MMQVMMTMMKMDKKFWCIAKSFLDGIQYKVRSDGHLGSKVWLVGPGGFGGACGSGRTYESAGLGGSGVQILAVSVSNWIPKYCQWK